MGNFQNIFKQLRIASNLTQIELSKKITPLIEEIKYCNNIELRLERIKQFELHQKLEDERKQAEKEQTKKKKEKVR